MLHDEHEGSSAYLFRTLPSWIRYRRIPHCRYRQVVAINDSGDETASLRHGTDFLGYPGGSGWAHNIGSVSIHYLHRGEWYIFSKNQPFPDQIRADVSAQPRPLTWLLGTRV